MLPALTRAGVGYEQRGTHCAKCGLVVHAGRWTRSNDGEAHAGLKHLCPGCERVRDRYLAGVIETAGDLIELHGVPHDTPVNSEGVTLLGYGVEHRTFMSVDAETFVEFTLVEGRVSRTRRELSRPGSRKNRAG